MVDKTPIRRSADQELTPTTLPLNRSRRWSWLLLAVALLAGGAFAAPQFSSSKQTDNTPLDRKLSVIVWVPERAIEPLLIEEPGILPGSATTSS
ncbi:MAG: hypothetical protein L0241_05095 [Planctomycetia bacterium]|nr:hypothetical protein [Planctomycetia bacterium]